MDTGPALLSSNRIGAALPIGFSSQTKLKTYVDQNCSSWKDIAAYKLIYTLYKIGEKAGSGVLA